jgi:iron complex outermembrane recepter protein
MLHRTISTWLASTLVACGVAHAGAAEFSVDIGGGSLPSSLKALEAQSGIELLYDGQLVGNLDAPPVTGKLTTEEALTQLLSDSPLIARRSASGAWIIESPTTAPLEKQDATVAEILVVGRRTQNVDIRRSENDIQPHVISTQEEVLRSHRDNVDQFITSRITANTTVIPSIASRSADVMSSIDLRGLSADDTVVLIDGRRMPSIPDPDHGFKQSDLNAIPLHAIERIEVLTGTAAGIHGFGALGGAVNVVLDRSIDGLELHTTQGISSRGDARRHVAELAFGHSFNVGATHMMLAASHQELETPLEGDRIFATRDRRQTFEASPVWGGALLPVGARITVRSLFGVDPDTGELIETPNLTFKPEFGGGALGGNVAQLELGFSGNNADLVAALGESAGELDFSVPVDQARSDLGSNPQTDSLLANIRHRFDSGWEAYLDAVLLRSRGEALGASTDFLFFRRGTAIMSPDSPANPFTDYISVSYPITGLESHARKRLDNTRYSAGVEADLPFDWRGSAEASWGKLRYRSSVGDDLAPLGVSFGLLGDPSDLETNPLGDWEAFDRVVKSSIVSQTEEVDFHTRFRAQSLRLAGPVFQTSAGPATLTLSAERRSERVPTGSHIVITEVDSDRIISEFESRSRSRVNRSFYGELRSPLVGSLELQLAIRRDEQEDDFARDISRPGTERARTKFTGTAYTAGAKISPVSWLMLRASYATGEQPPPLPSLAEMGTFTSGPGGEIPDPKRGGTFVGAESEYVIRLGGNADLETARARSLSVGAVIMPGGPDGARIALDYSRIHRARDLQEYGNDEIFAHEDEWPDRVVRAPLTDADRANGYTAGRVELIDARVTNDGASEVEAYDLSAEWPLELFGGRLRLYADATYHKRNDRIFRFQTDYAFAGYLDGPLKRRANGGFDWSKNDLTVGANLQYFGSTLVFLHDATDPRALSLLPEDAILLQGASHIPAQEYLDLYGSLRLPTRYLGAVDSFTLDLGIVNVLDKAPPRESTFLNGVGPGYSRYGDPRMRRFELGLSCRF